MTPRVESLELATVRGAVAPLAGAASGQTVRAGLLLRVLDARGGGGVGEASPLPGYSPDTIDDCRRELAAIDPRALPAADDVDTLGWLERAVGASRVVAPAARFALETALLDWLGRARGVPLASLLGGPEASRRRVELSALVADVAGARAAYARGVRAFKLKVSEASFDADVELAAALRDAYGDGIRLRFDANRRFDRARAARRLESLARFAPEFVEEPVPTADLLAMGRAPVPLAADESLAVARAWPALAARCRVVVLKPTLLGGFGACLRIAREAAARGLAATVTHTFDGPLALAAAAELACALPALVLACGLDPHAGLDAWPRVAIPQIGAAHALSSGLPGLGPVADALARSAG